MNWELDKIYNLADPIECELYLQRIHDVLLGHYDPKERKMNDNHELVGEANTVATLMAANNGLPVAAGDDLLSEVPFDGPYHGVGETAQPEAEEIFVSEDATSHAVN